MKTALIGGNGFIGARIAAALLSAGHTPCIISRQQQPPGGAQFEQRGYRTQDPLSLQAALAGCEAVIFLPGILHGSEKDFEAVHVDLVRAVVQACEAVGIRRYLHMSALGADTAAPSRYLRSKGRAEQLVQASTLDWTIMRPSVVYGREDRFVSLFVRMARFLPVLPLAGARARFQPVWVEDVAAAFALALQLNDSVAQSYDLVGPEVYTLAEIVRLCASAHGRRVLVLPLPEPLARWQAALLEHLPGPLMSRDNLDSMRVDNISARDYPALFGRQPANLEAWLADGMHR